MATKMRDIYDGVATLYHELGALGYFEDRIDQLDAKMQAQNELISNLEKQQIINFNLSSKIRGLHLSDERVAELRRMLAE